MSAMYFALPSAAVQDCPINMAVIQPESRLVTLVIFLTSVGAVTFLHDLDPRIVSGETPAFVRVVQSIIQIWIEG